MVSTKTIVAINLLFLVILLSLNPVLAESSTEKIVLLAIDDFQSGYLEDIQEYIVQEHINNNIPVTLGVIPSMIEEPLLTKIRDWNNNSIIEVAQHDYTHNTTLIDMNYSFQYNYLKKGTELFNKWGIYPKSFVPAAGQADDTTVQVVKDLGFHTIYDGIYINLTSNTNPLVLVNQLHLCEENGMGPDCRFKSYKSIEPEIEQKIQQQGVALVMYHMQDFESKNNGRDINKMNDLIAFANKLKQKGYTLMTIEQYYKHRFKDQHICGNKIIEITEECDDGNLINGDGCNSKCQIESVQVYLAPYVGDIDGSIDSDWFFFYKQIGDWHNNNSIPAGFSFYPMTMGDNQFNMIVANLYFGEDTELITKGEAEWGGIPINLINYSEMRHILRQWQDNFVRNIESLGYYSVKAPTVYNQRLANFTETIRNATHDEGFKMYFDQYLGGNDYVDPLPDYDVLQYSVSFTESGYAGPDEKFKDKEQIIQEILNFSHNHMIYINNTKVVPLLCHQQDFMTNQTSSLVDEKKWNIYTETLLAAKNDSRIKLVKPEDIYNARHSGAFCGNNISEITEECDDGNLVNGDGCNSKCRIEELPICQYALLAEATDELPGYESKYSTGIPDSEGLCKTEPSQHKSWQKTNWNITANLTLTFPKTIYPDNLTILGDYDLCINKIWLWRNNVWYLAQKGAIDKSTDANCSINYKFNVLDFKTNKIKLETCSWSWSAIDAVKLCGSKKSFPKLNIIAPLQDQIIDNSSNGITLKISTDVKSECEFSYNKTFNFGEGIGLLTSDGLMHSYYLRNQPKDSVEIYYKCRQLNTGKTNPYSLMHRFKFRKSDKPFIEVCNWYNCFEGAVSISDDDGYHNALGKVKAVCSEELEKRNLKGTYFLAFTNTYNSSDWNIWKRAYKYGHEIGGHMGNCSYGRTKEDYTGDIQRNIDDMINHIGMSRKNITTFAWPCGVATPDYRNWISKYYLFERGYHVNLIEDKNPKDMQYIKSINSVGFGDMSPDRYLLADVAENHQDWVHYVYHDSCDNPELFDYLLTRNLWIETIGTVSKYITERNAVKMQNVAVTPTGVKFDLVNDLNTTIFDKELTLKIYTGNRNVEGVKINGINTKITQFTQGGQLYIKFNVPSSKINKIEVVGLKVEIPYCGDGKINQKSEECDDGNLINGDGCNNNCKSEPSEHLYVILYIGNIDGSASTIWYPFYDKLTSYFENNKIPVLFSFFSEDIRVDNEFANIFKRRYLAENIELGQKGFAMNETEKHLDKLPPEEQRHIIKYGRFYFIEEMKKILGTEDIKIPVTYIAPFGRFTVDTRRALQELGFRTNFGLYYPDDLKPVESTPTLDSFQYGVSFTINGTAGRNTTFKNPDQIIREIFSYDRKDVKRVNINGKKIIPLYAHHVDFEDRIVNGKIDEVKWNIYKKTISKLLANSSVIFVTPNQVWNLRHPVCIPTGIPETFCNGVDDDCDGSIDEECNGETYEGFVFTPNDNLKATSKLIGEILNSVIDDFHTWESGVLTGILLTIILMSVLNKRNKKKNEYPGELI